jgi:hypothetical protein
VFTVIGQGCKIYDRLEGRLIVKKPKATKPGVVQKIIKSTYAQEPEKAEIAVEGADHLYREIRIENKLEDASGKKVKLKEGAHVEVTVEADARQTVPASGK